MVFSGGWGSLTRFQGKFCVISGEFLWIWMDFEDFQWFGGRPGGFLEGIYKRIYKGISRGDL